jgi:hypothetical protein
MIAKREEMETGAFLGKLPYVRLGNGTENLVIAGDYLEQRAP